MAAVLTAASVLHCPHAAPLVVLPSQHLLTVDNEPALLAADVRKAGIPACPGNPKCGSVLDVTAGLSRTLHVGQDPVLLDTATGNTNVAAWTVFEVRQTKLVAS
jgi:hypothetical protein